MTQWVALYGWTGMTPILAVLGLVSWCFVGFCLRAYRGD